MAEITRCIQCTRTAADVFEATASTPAHWLDSFTCSRCGSEWRWNGKPGGWLETWDLMSDPDPWPEYARVQQGRDIAAALDRPVIAPRKQR